MPNSRAPNLLLLSMFVILVACQVPVRIAQPVQPDNTGSTSLINQPDEIGYKVKVFRIPVIVNKPMDAVLKIDFVISSAGHCATTYEPTVIALNNRQLVSFDFRRHFLKTRIERKVKISREEFVTGENVFTIRSGACQYDIDVFDLNGLELSF